MLGLDLFPGYDTFTAAGVPVIGVLPILPGDYTAKALFLTGGNTTTTAAMATFAQKNFDATTVGIVSADNAGANGTEAALKTALDKAGITYTTVKGGDNETDAGYQGLMSQATADDPDVLFSLYADAGCIGTMRGRASLGIETPVITTGICSGAEVIDEVGDDAAGWYFIGVSTEETGTSQADDLQEIVESLGFTNSTALGLGALGLTVVDLATFGNRWPRTGESHGARSTTRSARPTGSSCGPTVPITCGARAVTRRSATSSSRSRRTCPGQGSRPFPGSRHSTPRRTCRDVGRPATR